MSDTWNDNDSNPLDDLNKAIETLKNKSAVEGMRKERSFLIPCGECGPFDVTDEEIVKNCLSTPITPLKLTCPICSKVYYEV